MLGLVRRTMIVTAGLAVSLGAAACEKEQKWETATTKNMNRMDASQASGMPYRSDMVDNAILRDMSLTDSHFVAHTGEINGLGVARLERMARLLNTYGGAVRYQTDSRDEKLVKQRLDHVREYLKLTGCNMERVTVATGLAGGEGLPGDEAIAKYKQGTAKPKQGGSTSTINIGSPASAGGN